MRRFLSFLVMTLFILALAGCSEQREKIADLFRWGEKEMKHEIKKVDPKAAEELDMSKMTLETLKKQGLKMTEIPSEAVFVSPERQQVSGVRFGRAEYRNLDRVIRTVGRIEFDEKKISMVNPKIGGWIEELYVDYTGKMVRKGQPLLSIYSPDLVAAQEEVLLALKAKKILGASPIAEVAEGGDRLLQGARRRLLLWDITPKQLETLEQTGEIKKSMVLYSPADGFVLEKMAYKGMALMPGAALYKIGDLSSIWVIGDIYEYELPFVKIGDKAQITLAYFPGETFEGTATYIYPMLDPKTRTAKVRFDLPNPEFKLKPEMWANVELKIALGRKLVIPEDAVMDSGTMQMVFVDRGQGYFESRHIQVGSKVQGYYEVLSGLKEGEKVVTSANFLIDSESRLSGAMGGMAGMEGMGHQH
ncbi:MAG TPA: efflux RND transporter periplasmic adaptor subunit [Thermodesulfobacteriota bacterium]|nr:efflux RND transporter periplasmic adaptor subunit [Thermodesulfobacteriota bacterium]